MAARNRTAAKSRHNRIVDLINLAGTYFEDGAWFTAAARLEEAAALMREGQTEFNRALAATAAS